MIIQIRPISNPMPTIFKNTEMNLGFCLLWNTDLLGQTVCSDLCIKLDLFSTFCKPLENTRRCDRQCACEWLWKVHQKSVSKFLKHNNEVPDFQPALMWNFLMCPHIFLYNTKCLQIVVDLKIIWWVVSFLNLQLSKTFVCRSFVKTWHLHIGMYIISSTKISTVSRQRIMILKTLTKYKVGFFYVKFALCTFLLAL